MGGRSKWCTATFGKLKLLPTTVSLENHWVATSQIVAPSPQKNSATSNLAKIVNYYFSLDYFFSSGS